MLRRFLNLFMQDIIVALRNYFHIVILVLVTLMILFINFAVPEKVKLTPTEYILDKTEGKVFEKYLIEEGADSTRFFNSRDDLIDKVQKDSNSLGIIIEGDIQTPKVTIIHQGTESTEILNVLDATIENALDTIRKTARETNSKVLLLREKSKPIPFNKNLVPIMLVTEAVMLGFLLIAVMVFQEKEEGSIRAYRVSPAGTIEYILSKAAVNTLLALLYSVILVTFTLGTKVNYLGLILLIFVSSLFVTLLGLSVSVYFRTLQEFLFVGVFFMSILGLPIASYLSPSFAPSFITWIPSYNILFGLREVLFSTGKAQFLFSLIIILAVESIILLGISYWSVRRKLMKEGR